jgi:hypothetical protein
MASIITQDLKKSIHYYNGSCSVKVKLNYKKGTFSFGKTTIHKNATPDEVKALYEKASSYAVQALGNKVTTA